jgi:hypothetical protein
MESRIVLPHGWWHENVRHRSADLRPLTGEDEEALLDPAPSLAERTSALIARCVPAIGTVTPIAIDDAAALTIGDREALVLALRRATFGERLQCVVRCESCDAAMDLELAVRTLLLSPYSDDGPEYDEEIPSASGVWRVRFHLPTGGDQIAAARAGPGDPERGARELLARCLGLVMDPDGREADRTTLPSAVADAIAARMAALDPQAEVSLTYACAECGARTSSVLDAAAFFFRELGGDADRLYREVHRIAVHYHWSEREILALTHGKRRRYLELLAEAGAAP